MASHRDPVIVGVASTEGVYYALCRACGAHSPVVEESIEALALLDRRDSARACYLQGPLFEKAAHTRQEERVWPGAA